jgi:hypothetical protein
VEIPPFAKAAKDGHPRDGELKKKRDKAGHPSVPQDYDSKVVRRSERHVSCVGGVKSHPLQMRQRMGHHEMVSSRRSGIRRATRPFARLRQQGGSALGKACGCVGGVEIPPFAKVAKDGAPTGW